MNDDTSLPMSVAKDTGQSKSVHSEVADFYWNWAVHESNMYTNRTNYILVAESMLFTAMAQLRASSEQRAIAALPVIYGLGVFVTVVWLSLNYRQLNQTNRLLREELRKHVTLWKALDERRQKVLLGVHGLTGYVLPIGLLVAWIVFWAVA